MSNILTDKVCFHCGDICEHSSIIADDKLFCCNGCKNVYTLLHKNNLDNYYCLNEAPGQTVKDLETGRFDYLNNEAVTGNIISFKNDKITDAEFYLPQVHCSSCLWLLENLKKIDDSIIYSSVNFNKKQLDVKFDHNKLPLPKLVALLASLGYEPHFSTDANNAAAKKDNKAIAYKLGIAGFCFANIMLISFPEYLGLSYADDKLMATFFRYVNVFLSLPVVFYCASEFFINSVYSYRQRYLNIDVPIALAIGLTFLRSCYEVFTGTGAGYFDSLSGIVFFMLIGRELQNRIHTTLQFNRDYKSFFPIAVSVINGGELRSSRLEDLKKDDLIKLHNGEIIPVDGILSKGHAAIDYSYITGESLAQELPIGSMVYAGGKVSGQAIEVIALKPFSQNSFTRLWNNEAFSKVETDKNYFVTRLSKYFSLIVLLIGAISFGYWYMVGQPKTAWDAITTILIVACPCALLLTATFTYGHIIGFFSDEGFFVKNAGTIEKMAKTDRIVFDKTGTLTEPGQNIIKFNCNWSDAQKLIVHSLMANSTHPLSKAVVANLPKAKLLDIADYKEIPGKGIEAWYNEELIRIGSAAFTGIEDDGFHVYATFDGKPVARFEVMNVPKMGVRGMMKSLSRYEPSLISGDKLLSRESMEFIFEKDAEMVFGASPQDKLNFIKHKQQQGNRVMMVGDGLNDAGALKQSDTGIAVVEKNFSFSPACDAIMEAKNIHKLHNFINSAVEAQKLIRAGFIYSLLYNVVGLFFATRGELQPVIAAILMPLSSVGIMLITYFGSRYIVRRNKIASVKD